MPSQARLIQALYAVSKERQFTSHLYQARLAFLHHLRGKPREGFGAGRVWRLQSLQPHPELVEGRGGLSGSPALYPSTSSG